MRQIIFRGSLSTFIFCLSFFFSHFASAAEEGPNINFKESQIRYLYGHDLFRSLAVHFPLAILTSPPTCQMLDDKNSTLLGDPFAQNGQETYKTVSPAFIRWYGACIKTLVDLEFKKSLTTIGNLNQFFGSEVALLILKQPYADILSHPDKYAWSVLSEELQLKTVRNLLSILVGPGILKDEVALARKLASAISVTDKTDKVLSQLIFMIATQDEFLSY